MKDKEERIFKNILRKKLKKSRKNGLHRINSRLSIIENNSTLIVTFFSIYS